MINNADLERRIQALESGITSKTYEYCRCAIEDGLVLRRNKKTGAIDEIDPDTDIPNDSYIIIFPEIEVYALYTDKHGYDELSPFMKWFLLKVFNAKDETSLMKAINKYWKQREKEDEERRAKLKPFDKPYTRPIETNKPSESKPISTTKAPEQKPVDIDKIKSAIYRDFPNHYDEFYGF
jgi:hypothetical protein